ncbi:MAG TPA: ATP-binding protein [Candidatus Limnocylindria bacterium]|jgi:signal transduction histidine kinase|nr:ATP-binding protein [Candidatus Limnocylindria bacterium]
MIALEESRLCRHLSMADRRLVKDRVIPKEFASGTCIFEEGAAGDGLYILLDGEVEIIAKSTPERLHILSRMEPGDYFGEMSLFDGGGRSAGAYAKRNSFLQFLPSEAVFELLQRSPMLAVSIVRDASLRMREFNRRFLRESLKVERLALMERVARTIVHDFRNPLNIIGIAAEMAADPTSSSLARTSAKDRIRHQVEVLDGMLEELIDFTKASSHGVLLPRMSYSVFLERTLVELQAAADRRGVRIKVVGPLPEVTVRMNPTRFIRVFTNLSENAFDAMSGRPDAELTIRFETDENRVVTYIIDNGPGIAAEHVGHLFEPFFTFGKIHGTGLGLAICDRIVNEHEGRITVESGEGVGAVFRFELPLAKAGDTDRLQKATQPSSDTTSISRKSVK